MRQAQVRPGSLGLHTVRLSAEGVRVQNSIQESFYKWGVFREVADSPRHLVLFITPRYALIVPKSAFVSPEQAGEFLETARAYLRGTQDGTAPSLPQESGVWPPPPRILV